MYAVAARLDPESYHRLARATFAEMALAGVTAVGEFHYLHHGPGGERYADPNEIGRAMIAAAREAGIRITLLDTCYLHGGFGEPLNPVQERFSDGSAEAWAERVGGLAAEPGARVGAAIHSVRAVDPDACATVANWADERECPLHAHVSEQPAENEACLAAHGVTPDRRARRRGRAGTALHRRPRDPPHRCRHRLRSAAGAARAVCARPPSATSPTGSARPGRSPMRAPRSRSARTRTPRSTCSRRRARWSSTSDSRPASAATTTRRRCCGAATAAGHASIGWPEAGGMEPGAIADLVTVDLDGVRLAGSNPDTALEAVVFAAAAGDVKRVVCGGREIVRDGAHLGLDVAAELRESIAAVTSMSAIAIDRIGLLVTNDPELGEGPLGIVRDAALVIEDGRVAAIEPAGAARRRALRRRRPLRDPRLRRQPHPPGVRRRSRG